MAEFLDRLRELRCLGQAAGACLLTHVGDPSDLEILYLQSQDGNIYRSTPGPSDSDRPQLAAFQPYIEPDVPWMREATGSYA